MYRFLSAADINEYLDKSLYLLENESMKKLMAQMIVVFLLLEVITGILLITIPASSNSGMDLRGIVRILHRSIFSFAYLAFVMIHCWMLRSSIAQQLKKRKLDTKYIIILLLLALSIMAFIPGKVFGPYPISLIIHGLAIPSLIAVLIWVHILVQKKAKIEREKLQQSGHLS